MVTRYETKTLQEITNQSILHLKHFQKIYAKEH